MAPAGSRGPGDPARLAGACCRTCHLTEAAGPWLLAWDGAASGDPRYVLAWVGAWMTDRSCVRCKAVADEVMSAEEAVAFIAPGDHVGMSGFTGFSHPKAVPAELVRRAADAAERGDRFAVSVWTGSSTAPELDGALAAVDRIDLRMPYQSDPVTRAKINARRLDYLDVHLSHVAQMVPPN